MASFLECLTNGFMYIYLIEHIYIILNLWKIKFCPSNINTYIHYMTFPFIIYRKQNKNKSKTGNIKIRAYYFQKLFCMWFSWEFHQCHQSGVAFKPTSFDSLVISLHHSQIEISIINILDTVVSFLLCSSTLSSPTLSILFVVRYKASS